MRCTKWRRRPSRSTGRGIGYKLFTRGLIPSMATSEMARVYRLLTQARENGIIPWDWIVDETRRLEKTSSWSNPAAFVRTVSRAYRLDFWNQQPVRVEVWSEKGTVRGVLAPVLDEYGVGFRVLHGFGSATAIYDVAQSDNERPLIVLYVGDWDHPNDLRARVEQEIEALIEPEAWGRCVLVNEAEQESLRTVLDAWGAA